MATPRKDADELLRRFFSGGRSFVGAGLDSTVYDLRDANLEGADLSGSFIIADLRGATLRGVSFVQANVKTCDFRGADLRDAIFDRAALEGTQFKGQEWKAQVSRVRRAFPMN